MRKFAAIGLVLLLAAGVVFERSIGDEPAINSEAPTSVVSVDQLATLGPIDLINNTYTVQIDADTCNTGTLFGIFDVWGLGFTASDVLSTGTITITITSTSNGFILGVTVIAGGPTSPGDCVPGTVLDVITGNIDGGAHTYSVTVVAP